MEGIHNLKVEKIIKAFQKAGWILRGQRGSHIKLSKPGTPVILSIPYHKGQPVKKGLLLDQIKKSGLTEDEFLHYYNK